MQIRAHEQLGLEFGSPLEQAIIQDSIAERQRERAAMTPDELQMADFTDQMNHGGAEEDMITLRKVFQEETEKHHAREVQRDLRTDQILGEFSLVGQIEKPAEPKPYVQHVLGEFALRSQIRKFDYDTTASEEDVATERVKDIARSYKTDPRLMGRTQKAVRKLRGKEQVDQEAADYLNAKGLWPISGMDPDTYVGNGGYAKQSSLREQANIDHDLTGIRGQIAGYDKMQRSTLQELLAGNKQLSPFIAGNKPENVDWADWLSDEKSGASNDQLMNVIEWHADYIDTMNNSPEGRQATAASKVEYTNHVERLVEKGDLPQSAIKNLDNVKDIPFRYKDIFALAKKKYLGYHRTDTGEVFITDPTDSTLITHELNHAVFGHMFDYDSLDENIAYRWLEEAVTEHLAKVMAGKTPMKDVRPSPDETSYVVERDLLASIIGNSRGALTIKDFTDLYAGKPPTTETINEKLQEIYGFDVLGSISLCMAPNYGGKSLVGPELDKVFQAELIKIMRDIKPIGYKTMRKR